MDILKAWVRDIFIVVTALCFVEIVLPKGSMRKYLKFIFSVIILGVVLSPIVNLLDCGLSAEKIGDAVGDYVSVFRSEDKRQTGIGDNSDNELEEIQSLQLKEIYRKKIIKEAELSINEFYPEVKIEGIEVYFKESLSSGGMKKELSTVRKLVIKGEDNEYVSNIVSCVSQRLGIEEAIISYEAAEDNKGE